MIMVKRVKILQSVLLVLFFISMSSLSNQVMSQCKLKIESKIVKDNARGTAAIQLKVIRGSGNLNFYLIDMKAPQKGPVQKASKSANQMKNEFVEVFRNVKPSNYIIQTVDNKKCQVSVGGVQGLEISRN